jgi:hypothetical protein
LSKDPRPNNFSAPFFVTVQPYVTKLQWLTAETQRAHREDNFSFAVEKIAKKLLSSFAA